MSVYDLIQEQLERDGLSDVAASLKERIPSAPTTSTKLSKLTANPPSANAENAANNATANNNNAEMEDAAPTSRFDLVDDSVDFPDIEDKVNEYQTRFVTTHKGGCRAAAFSSDGQYVVSASVDSTIKLMDVSRMMHRHLLKTEVDSETEIRPVLRTYYDHSDAVVGVDFVPGQRAFVSASRDGSVKVFEYSNVQYQRRARTSLQDPQNVPLRCISSHPTGDYVLVGGDDPRPRLWDLQTMTAYDASSSTAGGGSDHHGPLSACKWSPYGDYFATASLDGQWRLWDGVSCEPVQIHDRAHEGTEIWSVSFSQSGYYVLTSGRDSSVRLWDLRIGKQVEQYSDEVRCRQAPTCAVFERRNRCFLMGDDQQNRAVAINVESGSVSSRLVGHTNHVRWIATSPTDDHIVTCSEDCRMRFWTMQSLSKHSA